MITGPMGIQASTGAEDDASDTGLPPPPDGAVETLLGVDFRQPEEAGTDGPGGRTLRIDPPGDPLEGDVNVAIDDPGAPAGFPNDNTFGWTTEGDDLDRWVRDTEGSIDLEIDMGNMARKNKIGGEEDYILEMGYALVGYWWYDGDGVYDPVPNQNDRGVGDDPCPNEPFDLFTVYVNGREIKTMQGHKTTPCAAGGPETSRTFEIKTEGDDPPTWVRIPKNVVTEGKNSVRIEVHDHELPAYMPYHSKSTDGWYMYLASAMIELAAPPFVNNHGWTVEWNPPVVNAPWQPTLTSNVKNEMINHFGQDPWRWAHIDGKEPVLQNKYDRKQDFRQSARELRGNVNNHFSDLDYSGKGWLHGHSMGGLVARYYVEALGGSGKIEKLAQTGSPNLGSWEANANTFRQYLKYEAADEDLTAKYYWSAPGWPFECCLRIWIGWRDWWTPAIGAFGAIDGPGHGPDKMADFMIKPEGSNPILAGMNRMYPAGGVEYFTVRGDWSVAGGALNLIWAGDGAVGLDSATMNGRIPSRTIDEWHEAIPERVETARWYVRYYSGLDLDNGLPGGAGGSSIDAAVLVSEHGQGSEGPGNAVAQRFINVLPEDVAQGPHTERILLAGDERAVLSVGSRPTEGILDVTITAPGGQTFGGNADGRDGVTYTELDLAFQRIHVFDIANPAEGEWSINIEPHDTPPTEGIQLVVGGYVDDASDARMSVRAAESEVRPGDTVTLLAEVASNAGPVTDLTVRAVETGETGSQRTITLLDDGASGDGAAGDGVYGALVTAPNRQTTLSYAVTATGSLTRQASLDVSVSSLVDLTVSDVVGTPALAWGGDEVELSATLGSAGSRAIDGAIQAAFFDGDPDAGGQLIGTVTVDERLPVGSTRTVTLTTTAPSHSLDLYVLVDTLDLEGDLSNNAASAAMPFNPTPRTLATITGDAGENGWLLGPATVTLAPFDGSPAPYSATHYQIDDGPVETYTGTFSLSAEGARTLNYWSIDAAGNAEPARSADVKIDLSAPTASWINPRAGSIHIADQRMSGPLSQAVVAGLVEVAIRASDPGAGISEVIVTVDGEVHDAASQAGATRYDVMWDSTRTSVGDHVLGYIVRDEAGREVRGEVPVYVLVGRSVEVEKDPADLAARLDPRGGA